MRYYFFALLLFALAPFLVTAADSESICETYGDHIHFETPYYENKFSDLSGGEAFIHRGTIQHLFWDEKTGCILVQSSNGLWAYADPNLSTPPTLLKAITASEG